MKHLLIFLLILFSSCSATKQNSDASSQGRKNKVLPVHIIYSGFLNQNSISEYVKSYFLQNDIKVVSQDEEMKLVERELQKALFAAMHSGRNFSVTSVADEMQKRIAAETNYAVNMLFLNNKIKDSTHILLGWAVDALPLKQANAHERRMINYKFLPQQFQLPVTNDAIKTLCDSVIASNTLFTTKNR